MDNLVKQTLIIGGGIAGLGTALFARERGIDLAIYEKNSQLECEDNLLWIAPNGLLMLKQLELIEQIEGLSCPQQAMIFANRQMQTLMQMKGSALVRKLGFPILAIKRGDLYRVLLEKFLAGGGLIHFDHKLQSLQQSEEEVVLNFEGRPEIRCDSVIAADGIGSVTRQLIFPESRVRYQGLRTYLGKSHSPIAKHFVGKTIESWGQGTRFVVTSLDGETAYWSAIERSTVYERNGSPLPPDILDRLMTSYNDYHPWVRALLAAAAPKSIHRCNFGVVTDLTHFFRGRVSLIGDAAHGMPPNMGQGASLGLEDAYQVAKLLGTNASKRGMFLAREDRLRQKRARQLVRIASSMNTLFQPKTRCGSSLRDFAAKLIPDRLGEIRMAQLYRSPSFLTEDPHKNQESQ